MANPPIDSPLAATAVTGVSLSPTSTSILVGTTVQLTQVVAPAYASNKSVSWTGSNNSIATVDAAGLVKGIAAGSATITVTTLDGNKIATCAVMVTANSSGCTNPTVYDMGFESGNTSSWAASWGRVSAVPGNSHSGTYAGQTSGYGSLNQDINLSPNTSYTLTGWLKTTAGSSIVLGVKNFGGTEINTAVTSSNWTQININFKTGILTKGNNNEKYTCTIANSCGPNITSNAATLTVTPVLVRAGCSNPMIGNPGFESGNVNPWNTSWGNYSVVSGSAHTGNYSGRVGGMGSLNQNVNLL